MEFILPSPIGINAGSNPTLKSFSFFKQYRFVGRRELFRSPPNHSIDGGEREHI